MIYQTYCECNSPALTKLSELLQTNKHLKSFIDEKIVSGVTRNIDLNGYLIKPIQRLCKYPLLIKVTWIFNTKELLKVTPVSHGDYNDLSQALLGIEGILGIVNEATKHTENSRKIKELENLFTEKLDIQQEGRYLVREDLFSTVKNGVKKPRVLFLFNDILLMGRRDWRERLHLVQRSYLKDIRLRDLQDTIEAENPFELRFNSSNNRDVPKKYLFSASSPSAKTAWFKTFHNLVSAGVMSKRISDVILNAPSLDSIKGKRHKFNSIWCWYRFIAASRKHECMLGFRR